MRLLIDSLVALMLAGVLAGVLLQERAAQSEDEQLETLREETRRFQRQVMLESAMGGVQKNESGYPVSINPEWFGEQLPSNPLLADVHPWLEMAGPDQRALDHPPDRTATRPEQARFWYNPWKGRVRARVPRSATDAEAVELYNYANDCQLPSIFATAE
jgi:type II secretory pathway pseudopilin PulG